MSALLRLPPPRRRCPECGRRISAPNLSRHRATHWCRRCESYHPQGQLDYQAKNVAEGKKGQQTWQQQMAEPERQRALEKRIHDGMAPALQAAFRKLPPLVARALLWSLMNYELTDWVKEHKGDRKKPDAWGSLSDLDAAALAKELTRCTLKEFGNRYNVKLDWPAIAEAFGVKLPAEKPAKKGKAKP